MNALCRLVLLAVTVLLLLAACSTRPPAMPVRARMQIEPRVKANPCAHFDCRPPIETRFIA